MKFPQLLCLVFLTSLSSAQVPPFSAALLQDELWLDGKAEYNIYEAKEKRYGILRESEIRHIVVREDFAPGEFVKADDWRQKGTYPVLKMNRIIRVPTGSYRYDQTWSGFWMINNGNLVKWSFASMDSCGNSYKQAIRNPRAGNSFQYHGFTYWQNMAQVEENVTDPGPAAFWYDEMPIKLRTLSFKEADGQVYDVLVAPPQVSSRHVRITHEPAKLIISNPTKGLWRVLVQHSKGVDQLDFRMGFPHHLDYWKRYDDSELQLKTTVRIPYWSLNKPGDEEALAP